MQGEEPDQMSRTKRSKMKPIYVVTIREVMDVYPDELDVEAFTSRDAAIAWIERQISEKMDTYDLSDGSVDGWCVEIGGPSHTIQYDVKECLLQ